MNRGKVLLLSLALASFVVLTGCTSNNGEDGVDNIPPSDELSVGSLDGTGGLDGELANPTGALPSDWGEAGGAPGAHTGAGGWADGPTIAGVNFPVIYFAYDQDTLGTSEQAKLDKVAQYMRDNPGVGVVVEGHCDDRGSIEYNRALGERRAITVQTYLVNMGVPVERFKTQSFGEERPAVEGTGEAAWSKNRRAELKAKRLQ